jgi:hypothetical protein
MTAEEEQRLRATKVVDVDRGVDVEVSRDIDLSNISFTEVLGLEIRKTWRGGIVRGYANVTDNPVGYGVTYQYAYIDWRVVGYVGSKQETIHRAAVGRDAGALTVVIEGVQAYNRIAVFARLIVDGGSPGTVVSLATAKANAIARMNRT